MKHLNYQTETFTIHVEVQDVLSQNDKDLITVLFKSLVEDDNSSTQDLDALAEVKALMPKNNNIITTAEIHQQVLDTLIDKGQEVSCNLHGECRVPRTVAEIPPNLLMRKSKSYKSARSKVWYNNKKAQA
tara:strand:+ start:2466 stop:2855 length:390 start_codon:yes stop_codon:yes gene_type:complete